MKGKSRRVNVDVLARVEGEGGLYIRLRNGKAEDVKLRIYEPPRFFEGFLRDRTYMEAPDITARICGICPVAYQMSSCHAAESAFGAKVGGQLRALRRLLYCGEWIESHVLHVYMLHAPDFLGYEDAIRMAADHPAAVERALRMKKVGNDLMTIVGGREIHPINVRVGGFYSVPSKADLLRFRPRLEEALEEALATVRFVSGLTFPNFERDYEFVALHHPDEYPLNEGRLVSNRGLDIDISEFEKVFVEEDVEHSNALHSVVRERGSYFVGPMARFNLDFDQLTPKAKAIADEVGFLPPVKNPFKGIVARAVEIVFACEEGLRIIDAYEPPTEPFVEVRPRRSRGHGCTEAPRGILYHRYDYDAGGGIVEVKIVPPTAQNLMTMESDLKAYAEANQSLDDEALTWQCEQAVRNYDPCISCATHFLKLEIDRG
jgi:coenzyme F420-reducing hydrogenase alpha subunit